MTVFVERHVHPDGMRSTATYSPCRRYRYRLEHSWDGHVPYAIFLMLNPSTATAFKPDPTVARCIAYAKRWRQGGVVVLNLFALRSTDPRGLIETDDAVGPECDRYIADAAKESDGVVCAWGGPYSPKALGELVAARALRVRWILAQLVGVRLCRLAVTRDGHPRHPLYLRGDLEPKAWKPELEGVWR